MNAKTPTISTQTMSAEFLAGDGEDEIGVRVGQHVLDPALAGAAAPQPAIGESLHRAVDLIAVAGRRIEKAVDAAGDVRQPHIGAGEPDTPAIAPAATQ